MRYLIISSLIISGLFVQTLSAQSIEKSLKKANEAVILTKQDSMAYAIGQDLARSMNQFHTEINPAIFYQGMKEQISGTPFLNPEAAQLVLRQYQEEVNRQLAASEPQKTDINVGILAPDLALPTPEGDTLRLSSFKGKYVLIDFWASWCRPCRAENPNVVKVYNRYKDKGFEILGVSLDGNRDAWVKAIAQDGLTWRHISDLKLWQSAAAKTYDVHSIPYTVLLDREGKVIAENLRGAALEQKLAELLGGS